MQRGLIYALVLGILLTACQPSETNSSTDVMVNFQNTSANSDLNNQFSFTSERISLPSAPKYTNKECKRLCFETGDEGLKEGSYERIFESRCSEFCDQIESFGGDTKLTSTINDLYSSALMINARSQNDIRYCTKYVSIQDSCIINMMEFENDSSFCKIIESNENKATCVDKFLNYHIDYHDSKICDILVNKTSCLLEAKSREAIFERDPTICLTTDEINSCYYSYFNAVLKNSYDNLTSNRVDFVTENLNIKKSDVTDSLLRKLPLHINGVTTDIIPVVTTDWSLCDNICDRNPDFMKYRDPNSFSGQECFRTICLTEVILFNDDVGYEECVVASSSNGQKEAFVDCLMAQAIRDNDSDLCDQFSGTTEPFVAICKNNVKRHGGE